MMGLGLTRSRKGFLIKKAVFAIVVFIIGITAWGVVQGMLTSNFLGPTQQSGDINQVADLAAKLENKCDEISSSSSGPNPVGWKVNLELERVDEVILKYPRGESLLEVRLKDGTTETFELEGCDYIMEGEIDGIGTYIIELEEGSGSSPTVKAVVS